MNTKQQKENFDNLCKDYIQETFGCEIREDITHITPATSGTFSVRDSMPSDGAYMYQTLYNAEMKVASNDPANLDAHKYLLKIVHGRVLISGLGLGDSLTQLLKKDKVTFIRVLEKEQDIINLVAPFFKHDPRVEILQGDIFSYDIKEHFDCIYHAIWADEKAVRKDVGLRKKLKEKYAPFCDWQGFIFLSTRGGSRGGGRQKGYKGLKKEEPRNVKKGVRFTDREYALLERACKISGSTLSELIVKGSLLAATQSVFNINPGPANILVDRALNSENSNNS